MRVSCRSPWATPRGRRGQRGRRQAELLHCERCRDAAALEHAHHTRTHSEREERFLHVFTPCTARSRQETRNAWKGGREADLTALAATSCLSSPDASPSASSAVASSPCSSWCSCPSSPCDPFRSIRFTRDVGVHPLARRASVSSIVRQPGHTAPSSRTAHST